MAIVSSPLSIASNNIVKLSVRKETPLPKVKEQFNDFARFLNLNVKQLDQIKLPSKRKIRDISNINIVNNFGSAGNLLSNLLSGALDLGSFITGFFPGKGNKVGSPSRISKPKISPKVVGNKLRLSGVRGIPVVNALFAGLDFATGLSEGESVGKAASGAGGSLVGSLLGGAIGQALIPIPGLGFVLGSAAGSFLGGWTGDRIYESISGDEENKSLEESQRQKLKKQEERQKSSIRRPDSRSFILFNKVLERFNESVSKFENFSLDIGNFILGNSYNPYNEPSSYPDFPNSDVDMYEGPVDGDTFFPLPGGDVGTRGNISPGQAFGAPRKGGRVHQGLDMTHHDGPLDAPVVAFKTGKVIWASPTGSYESGLMIDHGNGIKTKYFHITPMVKTGDIVYGGQKIARLFPAGNQTHLHFEVHKSGTPNDPMNFGLRRGGSAIRLPSPLSIEKAKENHKRRISDSNVEAVSSGVNLYPIQSDLNQSQSRSMNQSVVGSSGIVLPQENNMQPNLNNIATQQSRTIQNIQTYPSYSNNQSYIFERHTIINSGGSQNSRMKPTIQSSGGSSSSGGYKALDGDVNGLQVLNSLMKNILLTSLSSA